MIMMRFKMLAIFIAISSVYNSLYAQQRIVIERKVINTTDTNTFILKLVEADYIGNVPDWKSVSGKSENGLVKWVIYTDSSLLIASKDLFGRYNTYLVEPGDSIHIECIGNRNIYAGKGFEKFRIIDEAEVLKSNIKIPSNPKPHFTESLQDFLDWDRYLDSQLNLILPLIDSYKSRISPGSFRRIKANIICRIENNRILKYSSLSGQRTLTGVSVTDLIEIMDSTLNKPSAWWLRSVDSKFESMVYHYTYVTTQVLIKKYRFNLEDSEINTAAKRRMAYYNYAKSYFKGHLREQVLAYILTSNAIKTVGFEPEIEAILDDYYSQSFFPEYKKWVKKYESRQKTLTTGSRAPDFNLTDKNGIKFTKDHVNGKVVLLDFWFTGCSGCLHITPVLEKIEEEFKNEPNVVFLSVSIDESRSKWLESLRQKKYTTGHGMNFYTGGKGDQHPIVKAYNITSFPMLYLLDASGNIVVNPVPDPRKDGGSALINLIRSQLTLTADGPYLFYSDDKITCNDFKSSCLSSKEFKNRSSVPPLTVQTDKPEITFQVQLKENIQDEPAEFNQAEKMFVLSDIEGNFKMFRELLQANGIIDEKFNWTFGNGHLILNGDFFDRGQQVTECLWLIYKLEENAKAAGGYVHFILGNHEIMNLQGDTRYVQKKYLNNSQIMGREYKHVYSIDSELGRWLRTKNIVEKIGSWLFVHGGISAELNRLDMSVGEINKLARPFYANSRSDILNDTLQIVMNSRIGPYWYRSYYEKGVKKALVSQIDSTLSKFNVSRIVTGHTIVSDTISVHYDGKIINVDTRHAQGKSEALLVKEDQIYRVNERGDRVLLHQNNRNYVLRFNMK